MDEDVHLATALAVSLRHSSIARLDASGNLVSQEIQYIDSAVMGTLLEVGVALIG